MVGQFVRNTVKKIYTSFRAKDVKKLRRISNECTRYIVTQADPEVLDLAVLSYMLSKTFSKAKYWKNRSINESMNKLKDNLNRILFYAKRDEIDSMKRTLKSTIEIMERIDKTDKRYVRDLEESGKLKIGARLYSQGLSLGAAAKRVGIEKREILMYVGDTMMADRVPSEKTMKERVKDVKKLFS